MSQVTFRMFASARAAAGRAEVDVPVGPLDEALRHLTAALPDRFGTVLGHCSLMDADGRRLDPRSTAPVHPGAVIDVLPPFAGG